MSWTDFVKALIRTGEIPTFSSPIYWVSLIILVCLMTGMVFLSRKMNKIAYKYTLLGIWIAMLILEFFKQILASHAIVDNKLVVSYNWPLFPMHICSCGLYVLPVMIFAHDGKVKAPFELFYSDGMLIGGLMGCFFPAFGVQIYINYQTIAYHILLTLSALLVGLQTRDRFKINILWQGGLIFVAFMLIAMLFNYLTVKVFPPYVLGQLTNFFFVNWYYAPNNIPVLTALWKAVPYAVYLLIYLLIIAAAGFAGYCLLSLIYNHKVDFGVKKKKDNKTKKINKNKK